MSRDENSDDVPTSVNFLDPAHALAWTDAALIKKPYRPHFFAAFCAALPAGARILELGSGPGHLAREIVSRCAPRQYVALDFSAPMHELARAYLGNLADRVDFLLRSFRDPGWPDGLGPFDAVVTMQAAHETRNRRHHVPLFERARSVLVSGGLLLYCDGFDSPTAKPGLMLAREEQPRALERAGFHTVQLLLAEGTLALYRATA